MHGQSETAQESREQNCVDTCGDRRFRIFASIIEQLNELVDVASCLIHCSLYDSFSVVR